jgi:hypothetical protein
LAILLSAQRVSGTSPLARDLANERELLALDLS